MNAGKHTPGPWKVIETDDAVLIGPDQFMTTTYIFKASGFDSPERKANAHLIAAAPDMLEALESALLELKRLDDDGSAYDRMKIRNAIAKAKGEA